MSAVFTQGTIIEDIRSKKYPMIRCKGIVISARCDFAQGKISQFHCLSAMTVEEWIYEVLFFIIVEERRKGLLGEIKNYCQKKGLDFETIIELDMERASEVLEKSAEGKEKSNIARKIEEWKKYSNLMSPNIDKSAKVNFLRSEGKKLMNNKLQQLYNTNFPKYGFIPKKAFMNSDSIVEGLVVDLQDITQIGIEHKEAIMTYQYDCKILKTSESRKEINEIFFFENDDDFVIADNVVKSPWIEHILQLFANSFTRIGVDNATVYETEDYCMKLLEEYM